MSTEKVVETPKTWGRVEAKVEFEGNPRTTGPFNEVIDEYKRHISKTIRRGRSKSGPAIVYFTNAVTRLEAINGISN